MCVSAGSIRRCGGELGGWWVSYIGAVVARPWGVAVDLANGHVKRNGSCSSNEKLQKFSAAHEQWRRQLRLHSTQLNSST
jgi:hypothetical protein